MSDPAFRKTVLYETPAEDARNPLRLCICRFALIEGGGYRIIRHRHPEYEFMIPLDGPYESVLNGKRLLVHPGQQILIQPGDIHEDLCDGAFRFAAFRFRFEGADGIARPVPVLRRELSPEERIVPLPPESFPAQLLGLLLGSRRRKRCSAGCRSDILRRAFSGNCLERSRRKSSRRNFPQSFQGALCFPVWSGCSPLMSEKI